MRARFLINDGQHRRAAIEEALKSNPQLGDETVSVVFFVDAGLIRSQQMFADLNKHAVRPTRSISILYDKRDPLAQGVFALSQQVPIFRGLTETEKTTISNRSIKLFTLSAIYQATQALLQCSRNASLAEHELGRANAFWTALGEVIPEWRQIIQRQVSAAQLRGQYVHAHGVVLHALGIAGHALFAEAPERWRERLAPLAEFNWQRTNQLWEGRAMYHGKMSKMGMSVALTANVIKQALGLRLSADDLLLEQQIQPQLARSVL
jgi:DNA sulfur modification protein DndB